MDAAQESVAARRQCDGTEMCAILAAVGVHGAAIIAGLIKRPIWWARNGAQDTTSCVAIEFAAVIQLGRQPLDRFAVQLDEIARHRSGMIDQL